MGPNHVFLFFPMVKKHIFPKGGPIAHLSPNKYALNCAIWCILEAKIYFPMQDLCRISITGKFYFGALCPLQNRVKQGPNYQRFLCILKIVLFQHSPNRLQSKPLLLLLLLLVRHLSPSQKIVLWGSALYMYW